MTCISLSFVVSVLCKRPLAIDFLMDAATPPPPIARFKGLSWYITRRRTQVKYKNQPQDPSHLHVEDV